MLLYDFFVYLSHSLGKMPIRPNTVAPQKFFQLRIFFPQNTTRSPLENLHHLAHAAVRRYMHHNMNMITLNTHLADPPAIHFTRFILEVLEADGYFALQCPFPIFGYPYQMVLKPMFRMKPCGISSHSQIMPDLPPLRQPELASFWDAIHPQA